MAEEIIVNCSNCGKQGKSDEILGWAVEVENNEIAALYCKECRVGLDVKQEALDLTFVPFETELPMRGNFSTVKNQKEFEAVRGTYMNTEHWSEFEAQMAAAISSTKPVLDRIHVENHVDIPALYIKILRDSERVVQLDFSGDTPAKGLELDIYQKHRLREMGLAESGEKAKIWTLLVSKPESEAINLARIISHVLEFGYFLKSHKIVSLNLTMN